MIRRLTLGFDNIPLRFAAATLFMVGCSATAEEPTVSSGGSGQNPSGGTGNIGAGGSLPMAGQTQAMFGGAAGSGIAGRAGGGGSGGTAGKTGSAGSTAGGTPGVAGSVSVAGSAPVAGAAPTGGSGGGGATTCDTYSGTLKTPSNIYKSGYGTATKGDWKGYAYTFKFGTATITPGSSETMSCFPMMQMCAAGSIPASDDSGGGLGWSINQAMGGTPKSSVVTTAVTFKFTGGTAGMRVGLVPETGKEFCYTLEGTDASTAGTTGLTVPLTSFKSECYDAAKAVAYAAEPIKAIQVSVPGSAAAAKTFDFCLIDIEPG